MHFKLIYFMKYFKTFEHNKFPENDRNINNPVSRVVMSETTFFNSDEKAFNYTVLEEII
jgi:hypothetical protein